MSAKMKWLQFFADGASGGDGGDGAASGVTSADAGQSAGVKADDAGQRLEALGVPKDKADKYGKRMKKAQPADNEPAAAEAAEAKPAMPSWDEFMQSPENKQRLESMMAARGKSATAERSAAQEQLTKLSAALDLLSTRYGKEAKDGQYDIDGLVEAITGDDLFFEDRALETGESVEKVKSDWQRSQEDKQREKQERDQLLQTRFREMQQQIPVVQQEYPDFDFIRELENPEFLQMVNSRELGGMGWDLRKAFRAVHQDAIEKQQAEAIAQRVKSDTARVVQSNQARPRENGTSGAAVSPANDYESARARFRNMTPEERLRQIKAKYPPR